jgi:hypothetical protein
LEKPAEGLFVLNGCLYTLVGLLDTSAVDPQPHLSQLIDEILVSLRYMLPLYIHPDRSHWSLYDLSHLTLGSKLNSASYSYHLVHITLLQCLSEILRPTHRSSSDLFNQYARRFLSAVA